MMSSYATMILTLTLDMSAKALRHPEQVDQSAREALAVILEDLRDKTKGELTGNLMSEAVRDSPEKNL